MAAKLRVNVWVFGFLSVACGSGDDVSNLGGSPTAAGNSSGKPLGGGQGSGIVAPSGAAKGTAAATKEELAAPGATNNCGVKNYDLKAQPAELLLVLDRSGSMAESFTTMAGGRARGVC